jgi:stage III sporulation protein AA
MEKNLLKKDILPYIFLKNISEVFFPVDLGRILEVRLRTDRPLMFLESKREWFLGRDGVLTQKLDNPKLISSEEIYKSLLLVSQNSIYAYMEDLINGFITIPGGHRVGVTGKTALEKGKIKSFTDITGLNFRVSHDILNVGRKVLGYIIDRGQIHNTLIVSPPNCGKTTILRDLARSLSEGVKELNFGGIKVGVVDERSEICAQNKGKLNFYMGLRTDVLDGCPKHDGMMMLLRTMSPEVIITDEIGNDEDMRAISQIVNAGVKIIASFHGYGLGSQERAELKNIMKKNIFERIVVLSNKDGPGTLEEVFDNNGARVLYKRLICG